MQNARLLVEVLHHLTTTFKDHAVLKGGVELSLFSSPRHTNDLDFVFVPFRSKKEIVDDVTKCLKSLSTDVEVSVHLSSKNTKFFVKRNALEVEVEISVAEEIPSTAINTALIAKPFNIPPHVIRVMKPEVALAHKIAAWNERRLIRDIYDIYFWYALQKVKPDMQTLDFRLQNIASKIPRLKRLKTMTLVQLCSELKAFSEGIEQSTINLELSSIPKNEREGLAPLIKSQIVKLCYFLETISQ